MAATKTVAHRQGARKSGTTELQTKITQTLIVPRRGVVTLFGYGISVRVDRGHLVLEDGVGDDRRYARLSRIGHGLKRLVIIGADGFISLAAIRWLADQDVAFVMLERDGVVLATTGPVRKLDAHMRRAQALALDSGKGLQIARELINQKMIGQERVARNSLRNLAAATSIARFRVALSSAQSFERLRFIESRAGVAYWSAWNDVPITFPRNEVTSIPVHWQTFDGRVSLLSKKSARSAVNPPNAILNYLYAVLESEARLAAAALGLDPGLGFLHADQAMRDSLALDLMEPVRPIVDTFVLDWIYREPLRRQWFFEQRDGSCRLMPDLATRLSETSSIWREALAPIAEFITQSLWSTLKLSDRKQIRLPTHLTQRNRREANNITGIPQIKIKLIEDSVCRICGVSIPTKRFYCAACASSAATERIVEIGDAARVIGQSAEALARRSAATRFQREADAAWDPSNLPAWLDREVFVKQVQPLLATLSVVAIKRALFVSTLYASHIRAGKRVPHPRHWLKLAELAQVAGLN